MKFLRPFNNLPVQIKVISRKRTAELVQHVETLLNVSNDGAETRNLMFLKVRNKLFQLGKLGDARRWGLRWPFS
jgi:hypothetical protein